MSRTSTITGRLSAFSRSCNGHLGNDPCIYLYDTFLIYERRTSNFVRDLRGRSLFYICWLKDESGKCICRGNKPGKHPVQVEREEKEERRRSHRRLSIYLSMDRSKDEITNIANVLHRLLYKYISPLLRKHRFRVTTRKKV